MQGLDFLSIDDLHHRFSNIRCPRKTAISIAGHYLHANKVREGITPNPKNLIWIHCRTGTLITALILKEKIKSGEITKGNVDASLVDIIVKLRKQRGPSFVQQKSQLDLLHQYADFLIAEQLATR